MENEDVVLLNARKEETICSFNLNGWLPINRSMSFENRISLFAGYLKQTCGYPMIICLQEVLAGRNRKFIRLIEKSFSDYEVILPAYFDCEVHHKTIMSVTLIRKDILGAYTTVALDRELLPNRINYVIADIGAKEYRILNVHIPQIVNFKHQASWYIDNRMTIHEQMWNLLKMETNKYSDELFILAGDFQETCDGPNMAPILSAGYRAFRHPSTVNNDFFAENCIDHIVFSTLADNALNPQTILVDNAVVGTVSDHGILKAVCAIA